MAIAFLAAGCAWLSIANGPSGAATEAPASHFAARLPGRAVVTDRRSPARFAQPIVPGRIDNALFSDAVAWHVNELRAGRHLPALHPDPALVSASARHAENMMRFRMLEHSVPVPFRNTLHDRILDSGRRTSLAGETILRSTIYDLGGLSVISSSRGTPRETAGDPQARTGAMKGSSRIVMPANFGGHCVLFHADSSTPVPVRSYGDLARESVESWYASSEDLSTMVTGRFRHQGAAFAISDAEGVCGEVYVVQTLTD